MTARRSFLTVAATAALLAAGTLALRGAAATPVPYPDGYRGWDHVKSMVIEKGHPLFEAFGGIHHVYANGPALGALEKGGAFPDGAVLVFDLLAVDETGNAIQEAGRKVVGVMHKDASRWPETGGWGFEGFKGDTKERVVADGGASCFACHAAQRESDYVFSRYRP